MTRFEVPSHAAFQDAEKFGKYLAHQLGPSYKFDHQEDELAQAFAGRRGASGRMLNEWVFGYMTLVVSNNPLFGAAIRFHERDNRTLLAVQGIISNATLRKKVFPILGMMLMFGAFMAPNAEIGLAIFFGWLPLYFLIPRLCALRLTREVERLLADAVGCRAAGIDPPPVSELAKLTPAQRASFRAFGIARIVLGVAIVVGAAIGATSIVDHKYNRNEDLIYCSIAAGFGLMWVYVGVNRFYLRRAGWLKSGLMLVLLSGACAAGVVFVAEKMFPPPQQRLPMAVPMEKLGAPTDGK